MTRPLPIPQEYYDENRERFDAETTIAEPSTVQCDHYLKRKSFIEVECVKCLTVWRDMNEWKIKDGKIA